MLSTFFALLALLSYTRYALNATDGRSQEAGGTSLSPVTRHPSLDYWFALIFFALGLMAKPMLVTLPFVLLLLDYWPLGRIAGGGWRVEGGGRGEEILKLVDLFLFRSQ